MAITGGRRRRAHEGRRRRLGPPRRLLCGDRHPRGADRARTHRSRRPRRDGPLLGHARVADQRRPVGPPDRGGVEPPRQRASPDRAVPGLRSVRRRFRPRGGHGPAVRAAGGPGRPAGVVGERAVGFQRRARPRPRPAGGGAVRDLPRRDARDVGRPLPRRGHPGGPVRGPLEALLSETARSLGSVVESGGVRFVASPIRVEGQERRLEFPPALDADGEKIRREFRFARRTGRRPAVTEISPAGPPRRREAPPSACARRSRESTMAPPRIEYTPGRSPRARNTQIGLEIGSSIPTSEACVAVTYLRPWTKSA